MSDNAALHGKVLSFIAGEFAKKGGSQCISLELSFSPGNGFRDEQIRKWVRTEEPDLFDNFVHIENLVKTIIEIVEGEADAKPPGKHRFVIRTLQHLGDRAIHSISLSPTYSGGEETALVPGGGGGSRIDVIANHAHQLMRVNASMFEGTIRVLGAQNTDMRQENAELRAENIKLRHEVDEVRSNKQDREFQLAMAMEKNQRTNAGFAKLLQIGSVVAAKIGGGGDEGGGNGAALAMLVLDFVKSLRPDQQQALMQLLDMPQKMMLMQLYEMVTPKEAGGPSAPPGGAANGNSGPTP